MRRIRYFLRDLLVVRFFVPLRFRVDLFAVLLLAVDFLAAPRLIFVDFPAVFRFVVFFLAVPRLALVERVAFLRFVLFFPAPLLAFVDFLAVPLRALVDLAARGFDVLFEVLVVAISFGSCGYSLGTRLLPAAYLRHPV